MGSGLFTCVLCDGHFSNMCIDVSTLVAGLLARCQCSEGPATGQPDTRFLSWFPCVFKANAEMIPKSKLPYRLLMYPSRYKFSSTASSSCICVKKDCHRVKTQLQLNKYYIITCLLILKFDNSFLMDFARTVTNVF